ncbi:MAG TPA: substrate-binding domain-containing protein [Smithellaceae bacterium]|nr:substrate-binding domain-containing protein [Smithellaceae bacterium]HPM71121.1 substrate-binding domain-containing protein [Smithellaceae bacterium]
MSDQLMNTKEVAEYLDIHEKQVYALIKSGRIPCTKVTGKWIFPKKFIDEWIEQNAKEGLKQARKKSSQISGAVLAAGSNDPVLDMLLVATKKSHPDFYIFSANTGSTEGLKALNSGVTDIALSHLYDAESGKYNIPYLGKYLPAINPVVVNLFKRDIGFLFNKEIAGAVKGFENLTEENIRFINRQEGSGIRLLLDYYLAKEGINSEKIKGYKNEVYTHFEVGLAIISGEANVGIASTAISKLLGLSFLPITSEYFDMIMDQSTYFQPGVQAFIETLKSGDFRSRVEKIGGYNFEDSGKILYSRQ